MREGGGNDPKSSECDFRWQVKKGDKDKGKDKVRLDGAVRHKQGRGSAWAAPELVVPDFGLQPYTAACIVLVCRYSDPFGSLTDAENIM